MHLYLYISANTSACVKLSIVKLSLDYPEGYRSEAAHYNEAPENLVLGFRVHIRGGGRGGGVHKVILNHVTLRVYGGAVYLFLFGRLLYLASRRAALKLTNPEMEMYRGATVPLSPFAVFLFPLVWNFAL